MGLCVKFSKCLTGKQKCYQHKSKIKLKVSKFLQIDSLNRDKHFCL